MNYLLIAKEFRKPYKSITVPSCRYWGLGLLSPFSTILSSLSPTVFFMIRILLFSTSTWFPTYSQSDQLDHIMLISLVLMLEEDYLFHGKLNLSTVLCDLTVSIHCLFLYPDSFILLFDHLNKHLWQYFYSVKQRANTLPHIFLLYLPPVLITKT